jgi:hypothetical protein
MILSCPLTSSACSLGQRLGEMIPMVTVASDSYRTFIVLYRIHCLIPKPAEHRPQQRIL